MTAVTLATLVVLASLAPALPELVSGAHEGRMPDGFAAWSIDLGISVAAAKGKVTDAPAPKSACALGDANGDGFDDLLLRYAPGQTGGHFKFEARAGPGFTEVLWRAAPSDSRLLKCGADVTGDATSDPVLLPVAPAAALPAPTVLTSLDGASGQTLADVVVQTGGPTLPAPAPVPVGAAATQAGEIIPVAPDILVVVETTRVEAAAGPEGPLLSSTTDVAQVSVVDSSGASMGTVSVPPGSDALAVAPVPGEDQSVLVLLSESVAAAIDQVPARMPTVTLANDQAETEWSTAMPVTTGIPLVVPNAGDVDGDGTTDVIYATVPAEAPVPAEGAYRVLSGRDGSPILASPPASGLQTALPLGDIDEAPGDEVLVVVQAAAGAAIELSAHGAGGPVWTATIPGDSAPAGLLEDNAGNSMGFADVTGDGVPDVLLQAPSGDGIDVTVLDGATGEQAWSASFEGADHIGTVPTAGPAAAVAVVDDDRATLTIVDGSTGATRWQADAAPAASDPVVSVVPAGDVDGDGASDLIVTIDDRSGLAPPEVHVVASGDGTAVWSTTGQEGAAAPSPLQPAGRSAGRDAEVAGGARLPWLWFIAGAAVLVLVLAVVFRRRRPKD